MSWSGQLLTRLEKQVSCKWHNEPPSKGQRRVIALLTGMWFCSVPLHTICPPSLHATLLQENLPFGPLSRAPLGGDWRQSSVSPASMTWGIASSPVLFLTSHCFLFVFVSCGRTAVVAYPILSIDVSDLVASMRWQRSAQGFITHPLE